MNRKIGIALLSFILTFIFLMASLLVLYITLRTVSFLSKISKISSLDPFAVDMKYSMALPKMLSVSNTVKQLILVYDASNKDFVTRIYSEGEIDGIDIAGILSSYRSDGVPVDFYFIDRTGIERISDNAMSENLNFINAHDSSEEIIIPLEGRVVVIQVGGSG